MDFFVPPPARGDVHSGEVDIVWREDHVKKKATRLPAPPGVRVTLAPAAPTCARAPVGPRQGHRDRQQVRNVRKEQKKPKLSLAQDQTVRHDGEIYRLAVLCRRDWAKRGRALPYGALDYPADNKGGATVWVMLLAPLAAGGRGEPIQLCDALIHAGMSGAAPFKVATGAEGPTTNELARLLALLKPVCARIIVADIWMTDMKNDLGMPDRPRAPAPPASSARPARGASPTRPFPPPRAHPRDRHEPVPHIAGHLQDLPRAGRGRGLGPHQDAVDHH